MLLTTFKTLKFHDCGPSVSLLKRIIHGRQQVAVGLYMNSQFLWGPVISVRSVSPFGRLYFCPQRTIILNLCWSEIVRRQNIVLIHHKFLSRFKFKISIQLRRSLKAFCQWLMIIYRPLDRQNFQSPSRFK